MVVVVGAHLEQLVDEAEVWIEEGGPRQGKVISD
jgi:hypothetical protein